MLRQYFDQQELLHDSLHIRSVTRNDDLYIQALQTVANLQTKGTDEKPLNCMEFLEAMVKQIGDRTQFADNLVELGEVLNAKGLGALIQAADQVENKPDKKTIPYLDEFIAEILDSSTPSCAVW
ncbi:MAG: hypothetical protein CMM74_09075 [Rhodospirillaceae bacterium]|nr:hypothetical protein [Rhodospirillaceae bacterium]